MINVYLDDLRDIPDGFIGARNADICKFLLLNNQVEYLSLDHDLGVDEFGKLVETGYDLVKWICEYYFELKLNIKNIYLHTDNNVGRDNMYETLLASKRRGFLPEEINIYYYPLVKNKYTDK